MTLSQNELAAIPVDRTFIREDIAAEHLVMVGHAGFSARTGGKVHIASLTTWASGTQNLGATSCSGSGRMRGGAIVTGRDFSAVTCKKCGAGDEAAARRNAKAVILSREKGGRGNWAPAALAAQEGGAR